jgi:hypothetical protein
MSWDCPENATKQRNVQIVQVENETKEDEAHVEVPEMRESLLMKRVLLKPNKEVCEPPQRRTCLDNM